MGAGRQGVTQLLAGAGGTGLTVVDLAPGQSASIRVIYGTGDRAGEAADGLVGGVQKGADQRLAAAERADPFRAAVTQYEPAVAVVADFKGSLVDFDVHLEPFEGLLLRRRAAGRPGAAAPAARETEGSHPQHDRAPVAGGELADQVLLVRSQVHLDDCLPLPDRGQDRAAGLRRSLLEGALEILGP